MDPSASPTAGVEIGRLAIVLVTWPALLLIRKSQPAWHYGCIGLATACIAVATNLYTTGTSYVALAADAKLR
jgi:hypothetical protein